MESRKEVAGRAQAFHGILFGVFSKPNIGILMLPGRIQCCVVGASGLFEIAGVLGGLVDLVSPASTP